MYRAKSLEAIPSKRLWAMQGGRPELQTWRFASWLNSESNLTPFSDVDRWSGYYFYLAIQFWQVQLKVFYDNAVLSWCSFYSIFCPELVVISRSIMMTGHSSKLCSTRRPDWSFAVWDVLDTLLQKTSLHCWVKCQVTVFWRILLGPLVLSAISSAAPLGCVTFRDISKGAQVIVMVCSSLVL